MECYSVYQASMYWFKHPGSCNWRSWAQQSTCTSSFQLKPPASSGSGSLSAPLSSDSLRLEGCGVIDGWVPSFPVPCSPSSPAEGFLRSLPAAMTRDERGTLFCVSELSLAVLIGFIKNWLSVRNNYFSVVSAWGDLLDKLYLRVFLVPFHSFYSFLYITVILQHLMNCDFSLRHLDFTYKKITKGRNHFIGWIHMSVYGTCVQIFIFPYQLWTMQQYVCWGETFWLNWSIIRSENMMSVSDL